MEVLELTNKHISMLLEICKDKVCNDRFNDCFWNEGSMRFIGATEHIDIPWLELCMVNIPRALATPNNRAWDMSIRQAYHLQKFYHHPKHVVDYLYYEFQKESLWVKNKKK